MKRAIVLAGLLVLGIAAPVSAGRVSWHDYTCHRIDAGNRTVLHCQVVIHRTR